MLSLVPDGKPEVHELLTDGIGHRPVAFEKIFDDGFALFRQMPVPVFLQNIAVDIISPGFRRAVLQLFAYGVQDHLTDFAGIEIFLVPADQNRRIGSRGCACQHGLVFLLQGVVGARELIQPGPEPLVFLIKLSHVLLHFRLGLLPGRFGGHLFLTVPLLLHDGIGDAVPGIELRYFLGVVVLKDGTGYFFQKYIVILVVFPVDEAPVPSVGIINADASMIFTLVTARFPDCVIQRDITLQQNVSRTLKPAPEPGAVQRIRIEAGLRDVNNGKPVFPLTADNIGKYAEIALRYEKGLPGNGEIQIILQISLPDKERQKMRG